MITVSPGYHRNHRQIHAPHFSRAHHANIQFPPVKTFKDYDAFAPRAHIKQGHIHDEHIPAAEIRSKLDQVRGHLVWMPLDFLRDENMAEKGMQVNAYTEVRPPNPSQCHLTHTHILSLSLSLSCSPCPLKGQGVIKYIV